MMMEAEAGLTYLQAKNRQQLLGFRRKAYRRPIGELDTVVIRNPKITVLNRLQDTNNQMESFR